MTSTVKINIQVIISNAYQNTFQLVKLHRFQSCSLISTNLVADIALSCPSFVQKLRNQPIEQLKNVSLKSVSLILLLSPP